jgi:hypothetical protein
MLFSRRFAVEARTVTGLCPEDWANIGVGKLVGGLVGGRSSMPLTWSAVMTWKTQSQNMIGF